MIANPHTWRVPPQYLFKRGQALFSWQMHLLFSHLARNRNSVCQRTAFTKATLQITTKNFKNRRTIQAESKIGQHALEPQNKDSVKVQLLIQNRKNSIFKLHQQKILRIAIHI